MTTDQSILLGQLTFGYMIINLEFKTLALSQVYEQLYLNQQADCDRSLLDFMLNKSICRKRNSHLEHLEHYSWLFAETQC